MDYSENEMFYVDSFTGPIYDNLEGLEIFEDQDDFIGKKARARRKAKRSAKKEAKAQGLSNRAARQAGRAAKKTVKAQQKADKGKYKRAAMLTGKAEKFTQLSQGANRKEARKEMQDVQAAGIKKAVDEGLISGKKAKRAIKKAERIDAREGKTFLGSVASKAVWVPLLPVKAAMVKMLKNKGVSVSKKDNMPKIANLFYNNIVKKDSFEHEHFDYDLSQVDHVAPVAVGVIISAVLDYFKKSKEKKDQGGELSKTEEIAAKAAEQAQKKVKEEVEDEAKFKVGDWMIDNWYYVAGAVVLLIVLMVASSK